MAHSKHLTIVTGILAKTPAWLRHDLASADKSARSRAEETLAAMIVAALETDSEQS